MIEHSSKSANLRHLQLIGNVFYWCFAVAAILFALAGLIALLHGLVHDVYPSKLLAAFALAGAVLMWLMSRLYVYFWSWLIAFNERMERRRADKKAGSVF